MGAGVLEGPRLRLWPAQSCEDGVRCGEGFGGVKFFHRHRDARPRCAALLEEMKDVRGSACCENCETEFRFSRCIRQGGVEAPVLWGRVTKYVLWKAETKSKAKGWKVAFGGEGDNEYLLSGMMRADTHWLFCDDKGKLTWMVNDIIE